MTAARRSVTPTNDSAGGRCARCGWAYLGFATGEAAATSAQCLRSNPGSDTDDPFKEGAIFDGRYRIECTLGAGGMGAVYRAFDLKLERRVALKIPHFDAQAQPDLIKRFQREARIAAAFDHPNLCPVFDFNQAGQVYYLTMPFIVGQPLSMLLEGGPLPPRQAATIVRTLALALEQAHQRGVVHRDLKPANVMISRTGKLIVMDFGIARLTAPTDSLRTRPGSLLGTPAYMAPEQVQGQGHTISSATDVYCLGVIYYQLLTGRVPFIGNPNWVCVQVLHDEPAPPSALRPELDRALEAICLRAMKKCPQDRYPSMAEMAAAFDQAQPASNSQRHEPAQTGDVPGVSAPTWGGLRLGTSRAPRRKTPLREALVLLSLLLMSGLLWFCCRVVSAPKVPAPWLSAGNSAIRTTSEVSWPIGPPRRQVRVGPAVRRPTSSPGALAVEPTPGERSHRVEDERTPMVSEAPSRQERQPQAPKEDPLGALARLRSELRDAYRGTDPDHPGEDLQRRWSEIHQIQTGLDEPVTTILIKVRKSKANVPLILYCDDRKERRRELRLFPDTVEVLAPVMPVTLRYVLHAPRSAGDPAAPPGSPEQFASGPPHFGAIPPHHLPGGRHAPPASRSIPARRIDLKNRELVIEFEFCPASARWKHHLHLAVPPASGSAAGVSVGDSA